MAAELFWNILDGQVPPPWLVMDRVFEIGVLRPGRLINENLNSWIRFAFIFALFLMIFFFKFDLINFKNRIKNWQKMKKTLNQTNIKTHLSSKIWNPTFKMSYRILDKSRQIEAKYFK